MDLSKRYDAFYRTELKRQQWADLDTVRWPRDRFEAILAQAGTGKRLIDLGCGDGFLLFQLRKRFTVLIGQEYSQHRLEQAKLNLSECNFVPVLGSAEAMPEVESNSVDCVISADSIEHIPDVYAAANEMFRVLRPGGQLVINTPNIAFAKKRLLLLFGRFPSTSQPNEGLGSDILFDGGHLHYFTFRSLGQLLLRAGFRITGRLGFGRLGRVHDVYPPLLSGGVQLVAHKPPN